MTESIDLPLWLVFLISALAAWALFDHLLLPALRRYFQRRTHHLINEVNKHLDINIPDFELTKRRVLIDRLLYDPQVLKAAKDYAQEQGISEQMARQKAEHYAKEIVPAFNAYIYFRLGNLFGKFIVRLLYRIRVGFIDEAGLEKIDRQSSIVFIMNHRSNMDYILLGYLALRRAALSFAVGEWARLWPLQPLIRAMGAYFVRRGSGNPLYRTVLARYVQMATEGGVVQVVYPEGRLSRDGKLAEPKIGLLDYMLRNFDPHRGRDIVFIPVGINYDRVLEDRTLLLSTEPTPTKKSRLGITKTALAFILHNLWLMMRGGWHRFGYAVANFGTPVSMREHAKANKIQFSKLDKEARVEKVILLAKSLMQSVGKIIPIVPVSLVSHIFVEELEKAFSESEIRERFQRLTSELEAAGAHIYIPRHDLSYAAKVGLRMLTLRHLVLEEDGLFCAAPQEMRLLRFYANTISHFLPSHSNI